MTVEGGVNGVNQRVYFTDWTKNYESFGSASVQRLAAEFTLKVTPVGALAAILTDVMMMTRVKIYGWMNRGT